MDTRKLAAARLRAVEAMPYLATAVFAAPLLAEPGCGTVCVDAAWRVHADPEVIERLDVAELGRLLLHLAGHLVRGHAERGELLGVGGEVSAERWNRAGDAEINDDLLAVRAVPASAPDLPAHFGAEPGRLAERYLAVAPGGRRWDCGSGADGCPRGWDGDGAAGAPGDACGGIAPGDRALLRLGVAAAIQEHAGLHPGTVPGGWQRWAEAALPSQIDWRRLLAAEVRRSLAGVAGMVDYTYRRPSRRAHLTPDVVLPSLYRPLPNVAIVCDTSGSMHAGLLGRALAEVEGILSRAGVRQGQTHVLAVDTAVQAARRVTRAAQVRLAGGGGTDMGAGLAAAAALRPKPSTVVVLTDGYTPWPAAPPKGVRVIVGLLRQPGVPGGPWAAPAWARTVVID